MGGPDSYLTILYLPSDIHILYLYGSKAKRYFWAVGGGGHGIGADPKRLSKT